MSRYFLQDFVERKISRAYLFIFLSVYRQPFGNRYNKS